MILTWYSVLKSQTLVHRRYPAQMCKQKHFTKLTFSLNSGLELQILNVWWQQVTFSVAAAHWIENKLQPNCLGPLTTPWVIFTGMAFSVPVLLWSKAYLSVKAQTNILSERVQPCALPQRSKCHFFNIINKGLGCLSVSFVKK